MATMKIKKGDTVQVLTGKDKGATGKVISVNRETQRVTVEGVNRVTRHTKAGQSSRGSRTGGLVVAARRRAVSASACARARTCERDG
jgi:large subunit ribosomal protein L24